MNKIINSKQNSFALIYAVMVVALISITIVAITNFTLIDISQASKSLATIGAFQAAQSGIDDGWAQYQMDNNKFCGSDKKSPAQKVGDSEYQKYNFEVCPNSIIVTGYYDKGKNKAFVMLKAEISGGKIAKIYQINNP